MNNQYLFINLSILYFITIPKYKKTFILLNEFISFIKIIQN